MEPSGEPMDSKDLFRRDIHRPPAVPQGLPKVEFAWMVSKRGGRLQNPSATKPKARDQLGSSTRRVFDQSIQLELEMEFRVSPYLTAWKRKGLAEKLSMTERQVRVWFQNRRMRDKRISRQSICNPYFLRRNDDLVISQYDRLPGFDSPYVESSEQCSFLSANESQTSILTSSLTNDVYNAHQFSVASQAFTHSPCYGLPDHETNCMTIPLSHQPGLHSPTQRNFMSGDSSSQWPIYTTYV